MLPTVCFVQGLIELLGPLGFASGYFWDIEWLMIGCGILAVVDDAVEIGQGILNPVFPVVAAILLGLTYLG